ncbi:MAG TPA: transcriptional repressor [Candidatus Saccharimonadia bacterium]|nr:transcriptional repressor [Candidatus Saccharimonadia bacterium]
MTSVDTFVMTLRRAGYSATATRRAIFGALQGQEPLAMHDLISKLPDTDRASVYRNVALFERLGIVQRLQTGWKYKLELAGDFHEHHHHATCLMCGESVITPDNTVLEQTLQQLADSLTFKLVQHQLELQGYCKTCQDSHEDS